MARKVLVFGVFDDIHEGHRQFFRQAKKYGDYLIAAVAQDHVVEYLKGRLPERNLARRIEDLQKEPAVDEVALGDAEIGTYEVVKKIRPGVIALGYDQQALKEDLMSHKKEFDWKPKIVVLKAHEPHKYKSSIIKNRV